MSFWPPHLAASCRKEEEESQNLSKLTALRFVLGRWWWWWYTYVAGVCFAVGGLTPVGISWSAVETALLEKGGWDVSRRGTRDKEGWEVLSHVPRRFPGLVRLRSRRRPCREARRLRRCALLLVVWSLVFERAGRRVLMSVCERRWRKEGKEEGEEEEGHQQKLYSLCPQRKNQWSVLNPGLVAGLSQPMSARKPSITALELSKTASIEFSTISTIPVSQDTSLSSCIQE